MSKSNYRKCVGLGVTGSSTPTCYAACFDKLLPNERIDPDYYREYARGMRGYLKLQKRQRNPFLKQLYAGLKDQINADELQFKRVRAAEELCDVVRDALREDYKLVLDIAITPDLVHSVGLETVDRRRGHYRLTSTHVQHHLRGVVTLGYIFPYLEQSSELPRILYPFNDTNLTLIAA